MKIIVNSPLMGDKIIEALTSYKEGDVRYGLVEKAGMKMRFETNQPEAVKAIDLTKKIIRSQSFASALYFQVTTE